MALTITHTTVATAADDPSAEINKAEWNEAHTLAGDYLRKATVTLSSADILALHTTPVTLVAAPGSGKFLLPHMVVAVSHFGETNYTTSDSVDIRYPGGNSLADITDPFVDTVDSLLMRPGNGYSPMSAAEDAALIVTATVADPVDGDGTVDVTVWYSVEDLP